MDRAECRPNLFDFLGVFCSQRISRSSPDHLHLSKPPRSPQEVRRSCDRSAEYSERVSLAESIAGGIDHRRNKTHFSAQFGIDRSTGGKFHRAAIAERAKTISGHVLFNFHSIMTYQSHHRQRSIDCGALFLMNLHDQAVEQCRLP